MRVRAYADLTPEERELVDGPGLDAEEFERGRTTWVAWDDGPHGILCTIAREVEPKGILYATRVSLTGDRPDARRVLLERLSEIESATGARLTRLGLRPELVPRWPELHEGGFSHAYGVLAMAATLPLRVHTVTEIETVPLTEAEVARFRETSDRAFSDTHNSATTTEDELHAVLDDPATRALLLLEDGVPVGVARWTARDGLAELEGLAILPEARGRGLGRAGLLAAARDVSLRGLARVVLTVVDVNAPAVALYRSAGFVAGGRASEWFERRP